MENRLNITCNEAIKKLKAIGTALTINWNSTYEKHVPIFFDFNYPRVKYRNNRIKNFVEKNN